MTTMDHHHHDDEDDDEGDDENGDENGDEDDDEDDEKVKNTDKDKEEGDDECQTPCTEGSPQTPSVIRIRDGGAAALTIARQAPLHLVSHAAAPIASVANAITDVQERRRIFTFIRLHRGIPCLLETSTPECPCTSSES
jgi:hypothetical protein